MTKKHFIKLADYIRTLTPGDMRNEVIFKLADFCQSQNPRFNQERWIAYINGECGPNGGTPKKGRA